MSTYVLVHGAWRGSWIWKRVRRELQGRGHEVFTPTLTGVGERSHLLSREMNLETHIADVINLIRWEELTDVVLCGHSYGGCVVTGVADRIPEKISALVYVDAFVPENGQSLHDTLPPEDRNAQLEAARMVGEGWMTPPIPAAAFNVNARDRDWVERQSTLHPLACFQQPLRLTGAITRIENITYILATGWAPSPFPQFYEKAKARGWKTLTMACGHDVMLDLPKELTGELLAICSQSEGRRA
ncbi:MAG TPA: alpha/beta hydrolase [Terriglobales bacterium]|nr:alpha/beta hydrolase [Terriglobales bacterium]